MKLDKNTKIGKSRFVPFAFYIFYFFAWAWLDNSKKKQRRQPKNGEKHKYKAKTTSRYSDTQILLLITYSFCKSTCVQRISSC